MVHEPSRTIKTTETRRMYRTRYFIIRCEHDGRENKREKEDDRVIKFCEIQRRKFAYREKSIVKKKSLWHDF